MTLQNMTATLGVVLLDSDHYVAERGRFSPADPQGLGRLPRGFFECPATWPVPTEFAVAKGATAKATLRLEKQTVEGLKTAVGDLAQRCDVVVANCGFFWGAWGAMSCGFPTVLLLSGLDVLDLVAVSTNKPIGVLTYSKEDAVQLLKDHPSFDRLRLVGLSDLPAWTAFGYDDYVTNGKWTVEQLRREFLRRVEQELGGGTLSEVGSIILECTVLPQFIGDLRGLTTLPVFDLASLAKAALAKGG